MACFHYPRRTEFLAMAWPSFIDLPSRKITPRVQILMYRRPDSCSYPVTGLWWWWWWWLDGDFSCCTLVPELRRLMHQVHPFHHDAGNEITSIDYLSQKFQTNQTRRTNEPSDSYSACSIIFNMFQCGEEGVAGMRPIECLPSGDVIPLRKASPSLF